MVTPRLPDAPARPVNPLILQYLYMWCKMATESSLPKGWMEKKSTSKDKVYYYNEYTKMTQWEKPLSPAPGQVSAAHALV